MIFNIGDKVNYHSMVGGDITSTEHIIKSIELIPNNFGCNVAWITGKSGCVCVDNLSNDRNPMKPYVQPVKLSRSKKRYQDYLKSEECCGFAEWLGVKNKRF